MEYINRSQKHECRNWYFAAGQFLFWEYLFRIFGIVPLQWKIKFCLPLPRPFWTDGFSSILFTKFMSLSQSFRLGLRELGSDFLYNTSKGHLFPRILSQRSRFEVFLVLLYCFYVLLSLLCTVGSIVLSQRFTLGYVSFLFRNARFSLLCAIKYIICICFKSFCWDLNPPKMSHTLKAVAFCTTLWCDCKALLLCCNYYLSIFVCAEPQLSSLGLRSLSSCSASSPSFSSSCAGQWWSRDLLPLKNWLFYPVPI